MRYLHHPTCCDSIPVPGFGPFYYQDVVTIAHDSSQATQSGNPAGSSVSSGDALEASRHVFANLNKVVLSGFLSV